ncbi:hypothetical protein [Marinobacter mobilis]|uniref:hypothetical protein n=1 Tax=Marinobacter mobilis TaxID=488533 RepID=UPI0011142D02|nr:hypothetical protein [Marinobacter mobilis]
MSKKKVPAKGRQGTNLNDVLIRLIDAVYNLVNSGNIVGVILLYFCVQIFYITQKLSAAALDKYLEALLSSDYFYIFPLSGALAISLAANVYQSKVYKRHIAILVETRKELIHGLHSGDLKTLKRHTTSGIDSMETADDC